MEAWYDGGGSVMLVWKMLVNGEKGMDEVAELGLVDQASPLPSTGLIENSGEM